MDRYDVGEFAGLLGVVGYAFWIWHGPGALLAGSLALLVEVNLRSRGRAPVRGTGQRSRLVQAVSAGRKAWRAADQPDGEDVAA